MRRLHFGNEFDMGSGVIPFLPAHILGVSVLLAPIALGTPILLPRAIRLRATVLLAATLLLATILLTSTLLSWWVSTLVLQVAGTSAVVALLRPLLLDSRRTVRSHVPVLLAAVTLDAAKVSYAATATPIISATGPCTGSVVDSCVSPSWLSFLPFVDVSSDIVLNHRRY